MMQRFATIIKSRDRIAARDGYEAIQEALELWAPPGRFGQIKLLKQSFAIDRLAVLSGRSS